MSNDNQNPDKKDNKISDKVKYLLLFSDDASQDKLQSKRYLALQEAQKVRQFEIELYWKRTAFFWAFITVIYVALFHVVCKYIDGQEKLFFAVAIFGLAGLGFFFSVAWHLVNKGSKFWQENWEKHVSLLEEDLIGPLYDVFLNPNGDVINGFLHPTKAFDFSVSKVNMWASFIMWICSFFVWIFVTWYFVHWLLSILTFFISIPLICFMVEHSRGNRNALDNKEYLTVLKIILDIIEMIKCKKKETIKMIKRVFKTIRIIGKKKNKIIVFFEIVKRKLLKIISLEEKTELNMVLNKNR